MAALGRAPAALRARALLRGLADRDAAVRREAALSADTLPPAAARRLGVVAGLRRLIDDDHAPVRAAATRSLGILGVASVFEELQPLLADADPTVRREALRALGRLDRQRAVALAEVRARLADPADGVRRAARQLLRQPR